VVKVWGSMLLSCVLAAPAAAQQRQLVEICAGCHGVDGRSNTVPIWGRIAGQNYEYLVYVLKLYRAGGRDGVNAGMMTSYVRRLSDAELADLARYYAQMK